MQIGLYKILFHFEALLHNNIFCKHPLYCAICTPSSDFEVSFMEVLCCHSAVGFWMGGGVWKKNRSRHGKGGIIAHYWAISPSQPVLRTDCAIYFLHDPLYCNKILAISCKGQNADALRLAEPQVPALGERIGPYKILSIFFITIKGVVAARLGLTINKWVSITAWYSFKTG